MLSIHPTRMAHSLEQSLIKCVNLSWLSCFKLNEILRKFIDDEKDSERSVW
jgi:hypothetical protein